MTGLALYLNGKRCDLTTDSVFSAELDSSGALQAVVTATWPAAALAVGSVSLTHWTVVNTAKAERELNDCRPVSDWAGLVEQLIPFQTVTLPRCQYQQVQPGRWEQVGWSVLPVEQGGTGLTSVADGAMLMGKGGAFAPLAAGSNASLLRMRGGMPVRETLEAAVAEAKGLRLVSGTYTGNGAARTVTLSVQPQVLWIWGDSYNVATLTQEAEHIRTCRQENSYYESVVKLSGSSLSFYNKSGSDGPRATCNVAGTTYRWLALVEVTA